MPVHVRKGVHMDVHIQDSSDNELIYARASNMKYLPVSSSKISLGNLVSETSMNFSINEIYSPFWVPSIISSSSGALYLAM